ncbi:transposase [Raoultella sp. BIGb0149]|uniref:integrase core domain-containing protein n=1 Tax=Raoultella sp. BIGb0149 TaxID=2485116 RepID=UPI001FB787AE|nr:transposase [Raoultella sp. BIGb0149]
MLDKWVYKRGIHIDFSRPGKATYNATAKSFNGRSWQEYLNENWFMSLEDARYKIEAWRLHYNQRCPYSALDWITPSKFAEKSSGCQNTQPTWCQLFLIMAGAYLGPGSLPFPKIDR